MSLTPAFMGPLTDRIAAAYVAAIGTLASGMGLGDSTQTISSDWGVSRNMRQVLRFLIGDGGSTNLPLGDPGVTKALYGAINDAANSVNYEAMVPGMFRGTINALYNAAKTQNGLSLSSVYDLNTWLTYYNLGAGGPYACLVDPNFALCYQAVKSAGLTITNIYAPYANLTGTQAHGGSLGSLNNVDTTKYAGCPTVTAIASGITGSGTFTVACKYRDTAGVVQTSTSNWTGSITGNGSFTLTNASNYLAYAIVSMTYPGGISAGSVTINGGGPATGGRSPILPVTVLVA